MNEQQKKARFGIFDAIIIVFLIACIVAAGFAFFFKRDNGDKPNVEKEKQDFIVSFKSYSVPQYQTDLLKENDMFYQSNNKEFGSLRSNPNKVLAQNYVENENGEFYISSPTKENGDKTKWDISGEFLVQGIRDDETKGFLILDDNVKVIPGGYFTVYNDNVSISIMVTDIQAVSGEAKQ